MVDTGRALYHRWRPQTFTDVVGQAHVTRTLQNALVAGRVAHAYLFTGPRGTGKTSVARILAKAVNCLDTSGPKPCNQCSACRSIVEGRALDLIEIDAASNTSVDDVRDLRDKINFRPNELTYRVYVIDETHMLSTAAFNALLKTLEEPPPHVIFVLATTEVHKVPATILSRCQRFDFRRLTLAELTGKLRRICEAESISIDPPALELIARTATGSFRDAESILDQLAAFSGDEVTLEQVRAMLGTAGEEAVGGLVDCVLRRDAATGLRLINQVVDQGVDPRQFTRQLLDYLRGLLLYQAGGAALLDTTPDALTRIEVQARGLSTRRLLQIVKLFNDAANQMRPGTQPQLPLEIALVEAIESGEEGAGAPGAAASQPGGSGAAAGAAPRGEAGRPPEARPDTTAEETTSRPAQPQRPSSPASPPAESGGTDRGPAHGPGPAGSLSTPARSQAGPPTSQAPQSTPGEAKGTAPQPAQAHPARPSLDALIGQWDEFLGKVRVQSRNVESLLKDCRPVEVSGQVVTLGFFYPSHLRLVEDDRRKEVILHALRTLLGQPCELRTVVIPKDDAQIKLERPKNKYDEAAQDPMIKAALDRGGRISDVVDEPPEGS